MDYEKIIISMKELEEKPMDETDRLFPLLCKFIDGWEDPNEFLDQFTLTDLLGIGTHFASLMKMHENSRGMNERIVQALNSCTPVSQKRLL